MGQRFLVDLGLMQECFFVLICASCGLKESGSRNCAAKVLQCKQSACEDNAQAWPRLKLSNHLLAQQAEAQAKQVGSSCAKLGKVGSS